MERASAARMAAAKPHGWVHAALGMGDTRHCASKLNNYQFLRIFFCQIFFYNCNLIVYKYSFENFAKNQTERDFSCEPLDLQAFFAWVCFFW